jgi:catechol 2,3-dioxygenase-like lactoylglutathione lyase family enzyme
VNYTVSIDVPNLGEGVSFYCAAFGFVETARPVDGYAVLKCGDSELGLLEKRAGTQPAQACDDVRRYDRHWTPVHVDFSVEDFEAVLSAALGAGAKCEQKFAGGEHPPVAFCADPFGNGFCIIGKDPAP